MNSKKPRRIWLVTKDGVPQCCVWAMVKTQAEAEPGRKSWSAALGVNQFLQNGWDATPTQWRRVPQSILPGIFGKAPAQLAGRDVISAGLRYNLDAGGRVHQSHKPGDECEPYEPDAVVDDEEELLSAAESSGVAIRFVERDTLKVWRVSNIDSAEMGNEDVLISRINGAPTRRDRADNGGGGSGRDSVDA